MEHPPPQVQITQLLSGFQISQALYAVAKVGIPDQLASGPCTTADLASSLQLHEPSVARIMRTLAAVGVFADAGPATYALTPLGETLVSGAPGSMHDLALMWLETHYLPFTHLVGTLQTGEPAAELHYGRPFFDWLGEHPDHVERFSGAMANLTTNIKAGAIESCDLGAPRRIVDLGGADGTLLARLLARYPDAVGVSYDLPHVVPGVEVVAKAHDLEERLTGQGGDFFERVPGDADTYVLSMILHDWDDESARRILANIATTAPSGAQVRAFELVVPDNGEPHMATMIDLTMLGMLRGRERTADEFRELVESAGLRFTGVRATPTPVSVVEATVS